MNTPAVAFLRAINVSGRHMMRMSELNGLATDIGWQNVRSVAQTGNVLFSLSTSAEEAEHALEEAVSANFGWNIAVMVRTADAVHRILNQCPFNLHDPGQLAVMLLKEAPSGDLVAKLPGKDTPDRWHLAGTTLYLHYARNLHTSPFNVAFFERHWHMRGTLRNWRTLVRVRDLLLPDASLL